MTVASVAATVPSPLQMREMVTRDSSRPGIASSRTPSKIRIRHHESATFQRLDLYAVFRREIRRLAHGIDAENLLEQKQRPDDADDRHWIGDGVTERGQGETIGAIFGSVLSVCEPAPSEGVFVEAPEKMPSTAAVSKPGEPRRSAARSSRPGSRSWPRARSASRPVAAAPRKTRGRAAGRW